MRTAATARGRSWPGRPTPVGFGLSGAPRTAEFGYTFDALAGLTADLLGQLGVTRYAMYAHDYGAPVGWRLALAEPDAVSAIITLPQASALPPAISRAERAVPSRYSES